MMNNNLTHAKHEDSIKRLVEEFGAEKEPEIRATYLEERQKLEEEASVFTFIPVLALNAARKILEAHPVQQPKTLKSSF